MTEINGIPKHAHPPVPVPTWIKYGGAGLAAIALLCIAVILASGTDDDPIPVDASAVEAAGGIVSEAAAPGLDDLRDRIRDLDQQLDAARTEIENNASETGILKDVIDTQAEQISALHRDIEEQRGDLELLRQWIQEVESTATARQAVATQPRPRPRRAPPAPRPPFQLVAIDHWGDAPNAVIRAAGTIHTLRQGARLQDWTLDSIDAGSNTVTFRNRLGQTARLERAER